MNRRAVLILAAVGVAVVVASGAKAASHAEVTWLPCGSIRVPAGESVVLFNLPRDYTGVIEHPMVLMAIHVPHARPPGTTQPATQPEKDHAVFHVRVGEETLPDWTIHRHGTAYVVNLATIRRNPRIESGQLELRLLAELSRGEVYLYGLGAPDPLLLGETLNGPLSEFARAAGAAGESEVQSYFEGLVAQFANSPEQARSKYSKLRRSKNEKLGVYARRGLRILKALMRSKEESKNFAQRYRWGLYLQQCGFFYLAMEEFYACTEMDPLHGASWFRLGEMAERCLLPIDTAATFIERAGQAADVRNPTVWNVLVTFLRKREYDAVEDGVQVRRVAEITDEDVARLKEQWVLVERMVFGASRGTLRLNTSFYEIADESAQPFTKHEGWLTGPTDDLIERRGWFDGVISVRPHVEGEREETGGGDSGPNGAGLSDVDVRADWQRLFRQWNHQFDWSLIVGECGSGHPYTDDAVGCGHSPIPSEGYGLRAAMRYYLTPAMYRHAKIVPTLPAVEQPTTGPGEPGPGATYLKYWRVHGPYPVEDTWPAEGRPRAHVTDRLPKAGDDEGIVVDSETDFIDLKRVLGDRDWSLARAVCWVRSPERQHVQMWLGHNDGMAVWVNGRNVHRGRYYATAKYEDRNQVDMVASYATLEQGWNRIEAVVESWPSPRNRGWGFSVRLARFDGAPVTGLRFTVKRPEGPTAEEYRPPETGFYYRWEVCQSAYHEMLPNLGTKELEELTGLRGIRIWGSVRRADGMVALEVPGEVKRGRYREVPRTWDERKDRDTVLNNVLDWAREDTCVVRFEKDGRTRDLLVLKPEAFEAYLTLLKEPPEAAEAYGQIAPADRVVGYITVPAEGGSARTLIVADVMLSGEQEAWVVDEEDLLDPEQK